MKKQADPHQGKIIERQVRVSAISITELSRRLGVSRRTIYNWFSEDRVKEDLIRSIGLAIGHDFSSELPELDVFNTERKISDPDSVSYWKAKYLELLEQYNRALIERSAHHFPPSGKQSPTSESR